MSVTPATVALTRLCEQRRLTARGFNDTHCAAPALAPVGDPRNGEEAWSLLSGAASLLAWLTIEGGGGQAADWNDARSLAVVLADLGDLDSLLLRFRLTVGARLRELRDGSGEG